MARILDTSIYVAVEVDYQFSLNLQVEQLHKIFKLCGSPPDEFWKISKLPHATMFKPQNAYESSLREKCKEFPTTAVDLIETFLSIEPYKRGTASSALMSQVNLYGDIKSDKILIYKQSPKPAIFLKSSTLGFISN